MSNERDRREDDSDKRDQREDDSDKQDQREDDSNERASITCRVGGSVHTGEAIDLCGALDPGTLLEAIHESANETVGEQVAVTVECSDPGPLFEHVGHVHQEMGLRTRTALARAGRSRGLSTPHDDELANARDQLADLTVIENERAAKRAAVADHEVAVGELREHVAAVRGQLQARRDLDGETDEASDDLREAIRTLSEHETEAIAARQELETRRADARQRRNRHERRFELEDRIANLERQARAWLVDRLREEFTDALAALPGASSADDPFAADPVPAALAVARVGSPAAPLVLDCERFETAAAARDWLGCPVILL